MNDSGIGIDVGGGSQTGTDIGEHDGTTYPGIPQLIIQHDPTLPPPPRQSVPEPGSAVLLFAGIAILTLFLRLRRSAAA